ncbi:MAG: ATPase [Lachnospiraceae bacterium]|nr:ATPase [Lachnospiraceae bacterium]MDY5741680.1 ATPase [Lachnospiraceae bacterium]
MSSRIEDLIEEIEVFVDGCKFQALSNTRVLVNKEELMEKLRELKLRTPDEIKQYRKLLANKEAIINDAQTKADQIVAAATAKANEMVEDTDITRQAVERANQMLLSAQSQAQSIVDEATIEANNVRMSAMNYTAAMLQNLDKIMDDGIRSMETNFTNLTNSMNTCREVVNKNQSELHASLTKTAEVEPIYDGN